MHRSSPVGGEDGDAGRSGLIVAVRRPTAPPLRRAAAWALAAYAGAVLVVALWPHHVDRDIAPLLRRALRALHSLGVPEQLTYARVEVLANVAMLVPLGALALLALGRRRARLALALGPLLSIAVELVQSTMPGRTASLVDVIANTTGALLGVGVGALVDLAAARRRRRRAMAHLREAAALISARRAP